VNVNVNVDTLKILKEIGEVGNAYMRRSEPSPAHLLLQTNDFACAGGHPKATSDDIT